MMMSMKYKYMHMHMHACSFSEKKIRRKNESLVESEISSDSKFQVKWLSIIIIIHVCTLDSAYKNRIKIKLDFRTYEMRILIDFEIRISNEN